MRALLLLTAVLPWALGLSSCSAPPKPPTVDESRKRPANTAMAVELQMCKSELQNTRILASESGRQAETTVATLQRMAAQQQAMAAPADTPATERPAEALPAANSLYTVHFGYGSTRAALPAELTAALVDEARNAPLVLLRGRTDGSKDSTAESRIARERAAAVQALLVNAGIPPARIRTTFQPVGDHVADNSQPAGQRANRRVEIEVYRALPVAMGAAPATAH
ncbi:outer membrane protein/peptidoglycan-associated (lipo)protein [Burkholderiales bacterium JOSHI_001]|nr:outer membrane protein/peptidoglycan-associated (lipo)protein [Burkholderiales bacterium JOSHI_001]